MPVEVSGCVKAVWTKRQKRVTTRLPCMVAERDILNRSRSGSLAGPSGAMANLGDTRRRGTPRRSLAQELREAEGMDADTEADDRQTNQNAHGNTGARTGGGGAGVSVSAALASTDSSS